MRAYVDIDGVKHILTSISWYEDTIVYVGLTFEGEHECIFQRDGVDKLYKYVDGINEPMYLDLSKHVYWEESK